VKKKLGNAASIHDVAKRAGVSIASVSRAMNEGGSGVSLKTREQVLRAVEELNYSPNHIGRSLRARSTDTYALILSNIQNNFFAAVAWELERLASERGWGLLLYTSNENPDMQDRCLEEIRSRQVSGIFLLCAVESARLPEAVGSSKVVFINRRIPSFPQVPFIGIDDMSASRELIGAALRRNPGRIGIIHGPSTSDTSRRRLKGMLDRCAEQGIAIEPQDICEATLSMESGYFAATKLLPDPVLWKRPDRLRSLSPLPGTRHQGARIHDDLRFRRQPAQRMAGALAQHHPRPPCRFRPGRPGTDGRRRGGTARGHSALSARVEDLRTLPA
jgi:LacI family transcriptional regulator